MKKNLYILLIYALISGCATAEVPKIPKVPTTAKEVAERSLEAYGGLDNFKSIKNWSMKGEIVDVHQTKLPFQFYAKGEDKMRLEIGINGKTIILATDGKECWNINPMNGIEKAETMPKQGMNQAEQVFRLIKGPLMDFEKDSLSLALGKDTTFEKRQFFDLIMASKDGDTINILIGKDDFLINRVIQKITDQGNTAILEILYKDRLPVDKYTVTSYLEAKIEDKVVSSSKIFYVKGNEAIADELFSFPK